MPVRARFFPAPLPHPALPNADWADAFVIPVNNPGLTAHVAARHVVDSTPAWSRRLMALRDVIVKPLGLKTDQAISNHGQIETIGIFPIIEESETIVILGLDDAHLNFRVVFETDRLDATTTQVKTTTLVKRNNQLGRFYLAAIMPFHRRIVPAMLNAAYGK